MDKKSWINMISDTLEERVVIFDHFGNLIYSHPEILEKSLFGKHRNIAKAYPHQWPIFNEVILTNRARLGIQLEDSKEIILDVFPIKNPKKSKGLMCWLRKEEDHDALRDFKQLSEELRAMMDSSFDGLWICDNKANVIHINKAYERKSGIKAKDYIGRNMKDLVREGFVKSSVTLKVLEKKRMITKVQITHDGRRVLSTGNPVFDENGEIVMVVCNDRDLSVLENLRDEILSKKDISARYQEEIIDIQVEKLAGSEIIHRSSIMRRVIERAIRVAKSNANVLVTGPSGSGKEKIAELIHQRSKRFKEQMIRINCGAIPESIFESEMFGHEYGAFTGAKKQGKVGLFELANQSTLFLDEVAEMPISSQVKLFRFLDNGLVFRVGATKGRTSDVRIIAATNQDLEILVSEKKFREDLFYRLKVIPIHIPPLKERPEDIPALTEHFLNHFNKKSGQKKTLSVEVIDYLMKYDFPGNVRELINICERLVVMTPEDLITPDHLPQVIRTTLAGSHLIDKRKPQRKKKIQQAPLKDLVENYEKEVIIDTIKEHNNQKEMAKALGVNESTITRKLKKYNLSM